jgi:thiaminase
MSWKNQIKKYDMVNEIKKAIRIIEELKEEYKDGRIQKLEDIFYDALENLRGYRW